MIFYTKVIVCDCQCLLVASCIACYVNILTVFGKRNECIHCSSSVSSLSLSHAVLVLFRAIKSLNCLLKQVVAAHTTRSHTSLAGVGYVTWADVILKLSMSCRNLALIQCRPTSGKRRAQTRSLVTLKYETRRHIKMYF